MVEFFLELLKSDHFGIEIQVPADQAQKYGILKSDHFGIEIETLCNGHLLVFYTKIRPFWD